ncbi:MAG TPA: hypothetical protein VJT81_06460 [Burkholderiales bacterium]|nr:hypothetical protein [Burkholderiales bacterium]
MYDRAVRVNYGRQEWYRKHGAEPACGICRYFGADPDRSGDFSGKRFCPKTEHYVRPGDICNDFERAPGSDDE